MILVLEVKNRVSIFEIFQEGGKTLQMHRRQKKHLQQFYVLTYSQGAQGVLRQKACAGMCRLMGSWFSDSI